MFNVLIVDDDPMVAELNQLFISRVADFHCCGVAATLADAKAMLSHLAQVDLLLLDVYMHQESGLDLLPALRAEGRNIDVIMMTSAADALTSTDKQQLLAYLQQSHGSDSGGTITLSRKKATEHSKVGGVEVETRRRRRVLPHKRYRHVWPSFPYPFSDSLNHGQAAAHQPHRREIPNIVAFPADSIHTGRKPGRFGRIE